MAGKFMDNFLKRKASDDANNIGNSQPSRLRQEPNSVRNSAREDINWEEIQFDLSKRKAIDECHSNHREKVIRKYLENRPGQPRTLDFPIT